MDPPRCQGFPYLTPVFPLIALSHSPSQGGTPWEITGYSSQGSRWTNCRSQPLPLLLQNKCPSLVSSSIADHLCCRLPSLSVSIANGALRCLLLNLLSLPHPFIPAPTSSKHPRGTLQPSLPEKQIGQHSRLAKSFMSSPYLLHIQCPNARSSVADSCGSLHFHSHSQGPSGS